MTTLLGFTALLRGVLTTDVDILLNLEFRAESIDVQSAFQPAQYILPPSNAPNARCPRIFAFDRPCSGSCAQYLNQNAQR